MALAQLVLILFVKGLDIRSCVLQADQLHDSLGHHCLCAHNGCHGDGKVREEVKESFLSFLS